MNGRYKQTVVRQGSQVARTYEWVLNLTSTYVNFNNNKVLNISKNVK